MDRTRYARYLIGRLAEAAMVAAGAALLAHILQSLAWMAPFRWAPSGILFEPRRRLAHLFFAAEWWIWPVTWAAAAHIVVGPKQVRPVYRRVAGAMYTYAGITVDRNAGCRGGFVTGATGSGKTLACIIPRLHSLCINEAGIEHRGWAGSPAQLEFEEKRRRRRSQHRGEIDQLGRLQAARNEIQIQHHTRRAVRDPSDSSVGPDEHPAAAVIDGLVARLKAQGGRRDHELQKAADACRAVRYKVPPWGGFVFGEKGNEWHAVESLLRHHGREEDLCLIRTRPPWAPWDWSPPVRLNLAAMDEIPADTFAQMIVDTGLSVEDAATRDEFFVPQARDKIAWGIRLLRAVKAANGTQAAAQPGSHAGPSLQALFDVLTVQETYRRYLLECSALCPGLAGCGAFTEARFQLENNYWNQPPDQLGGVRSTVYNFLVPYTEPEISEIFCSDSTFDLREIQLGKVVCLAIPQKFAVQRRYVATLMKMMVYQIILERFDRSAGNPEWLNRNVILVEQDEWQRQAIRADCGADIVREAQGAIYASTQSQNAVWQKFGGRENAAPLIANLRNRWICQAATEECADESSNLISGRISREVSYSMGQAGRTTNVSYLERPFVPKRELRSLRPFHVIFAPAEGKWLYRRCIAMPATPDGKIPPWWFGDWNPLHWAACLFRLRPREGFIPPWRACAPFRAQVRRLAGLDGTFIVLGQMRASAARSAAAAQR